MNQAPLFDPIPESIQLRVVGIPAPQGSKTAIVNEHTGRAVLVEGKGGQRERHKTWREGVSQAARDYLAVHPQAPIAVPVLVSITFLFPAPASDKYRTRHSTRPDIDKLLRSTFDALVYGALLKDDAVVCDVTARKVYCHGEETPGAEIVITQLGWAESRDREVLKAAARSRR